MSIVFRKDNIVQTTRQISEEVYCALQRAASATCAVTPAQPHILSLDPRRQQRSLSLERTVLECGPSVLRAAPLRCGTDRIRSGLRNDGTLATMRTGPPNADRAGAGALRTSRAGVRAIEAVAAGLLLEGGCFRGRRAVAGIAGDLLKLARKSTGWIGLGDLAGRDTIEGGDDPLIVTVDIVDRLQCSVLTGDHGEIGIMNGDAARKWDPCVGRRLGLQARLDLACSPVLIFRER